MDYYSNQMSKLIEELSCLPGIGAKSAARLAFHLIHMPVDDVKRLASTMVEARENIKYCKECYTLTDQELCPICSNSNRDHQMIMVVENTRDLAAYENPRFPPAAAAGSAPPKRQPSPCPGGACGTRGG